MIGFDTNILVYVELERSSSKAALARRLLKTLAGNAVVPAQVLGEFIAVIRRKLPEATGLAIQQAGVYRQVFSIQPTDGDVIAAAAAFADRYRVQFWDAVVWEASAKGGARILLTEDLQHGFTAGGMRAVNPYAMPDWPSLAAQLGIRV